MILCPRERAASKQPGYDPRMWEEHGCLCPVCKATLIMAVPLLCAVATPVIAVRRLHNLWRRHVRRR